MMICAHASHAGQLANEQILRKGNYSDPGSLDPHKGEGVSASNILRDLFEGLVSEAPDGTLIPGAAESWDISEDGTVYTFHMRKNAAWSDGSAVVADDFVNGLRRSINPATGSNYSQVLSPIKNADEIIQGDMPAEMLGVYASDDKTLRIELNSATPYFLGLLTHSSTYPIHMPSLVKHGDAIGRPGNLISNGAFILQQWKVQSHVTLTKNPHYWDADNVTLNQVVYFPTENLAAELKRFRADEIDWTYDIPVSQIKWIRENLNEQFETGPYLGSYYFGLNLTQPPFKGNKKLRQALSMVVDRQTLTDKLLRTGEKPALGWVPVGIAGYTTQEPYWADWSMEKRLSEARKLYQQAGYSEENPLNIEIRYNTHEDHKRMSIALAFMWNQALGVKYRLVNEEWKVFLQNRAFKKDTQVFRAGWIGDYNDPYTFAELLHSRHGRNDMGFSNDEYDDLLAAAAAETRPAERMKLLEAAERIVLDEVPLIPIYYYVSRRMVKPWVVGWEPNVMDHHYSKNIKILAH